MNAGSTAGGAAKPDQRSMFRLMCALCATKNHGTHVVKNPYRMFCTPVTDRILRMFEREYAQKFSSAAEEEKEENGKRDRARTEERRQRLCVEGISSEVKMSS